LQNPIEAITQHEEHHLLYARDPLARGFDKKHLSIFIQIVCENQKQEGFRVAEVGAGTGGLTRQVSRA
jgi:fatty acid synthase